MKTVDREKRALLKGAGVGLAVATLGDGALAKAPRRRMAAPALTDQVIDTGWTFRQADTADWLPATVPGTVHTDLLANHRIDDPFYRTNERDQQWIDKKDWEYKTTLALDAATCARRNIELVFEGLDTYADVYVNDALVLQADNMFRTWTADIKAHVTPGDNALRILFRSPITEGLKKLADFGFIPPATNDQSENGGLGDKKVSVFTRKAGYHYGWDWGPRFVTSGLWRPVHVRAWDTARIDDIQIVQSDVSQASATVTAVCDIVADVAGKIAVALTSPTDARIKAMTEIAVAPGSNTVTLTFTLARPRLWWSNGLGEAFLYSLDFRLSAGSRLLDAREVKTGLRTLNVVRKPDAQGTSFYVELNGVPVFMKGANYIPNDSFLPRVTHDVYDKVIGSAADTHMNMIRIWGGGVYEDDYVYDLCDRNGILVWQDFMFACSMYPGDDAFLDNVRQEAVQNVRRLRNHACLALWAGNNEIDGAWENDVPNGGWGWKQNYSDEQKAQLWQAYDAIFHHILPETVASEDAGRYYQPSSPLAGWDGTNVKHADLGQAQQSGDIHYWDVWWGQKPFAEYRTHIGRFMSEYGFQSFPEFNTVKTYAAPQDYDIFSEVMQAHQRSSIGNGTIKNYMQRDYVVPADFRQFLYVGQVLQAEGIKTAMEAHRSRMSYCMGSLFWQINDCWPVASWSSIDYYGRWKAQQYFAVKAFDTVLVSPQLDDATVHIYAVSDLLTDRTVSLSLRLMDFSGKVLSSESVSLTLKANTAALVMTRDVADILKGAAAANVLLSVRLIEGGRVLAGNILYLAPVKDLILPKPAIVKTVKSAGGDMLVGLRSDRLVKNLYLSLDEDSGKFSDNYFDMLPGETTMVRFKPAKAMTARTFESRLTLMHMADIPPA